MDKKYLIALVVSIMISFGQSAIFANNVDDLSFNSSLASSGDQSFQLGQDTDVPMYADNRDHFLPSEDQLVYDLNSLNATVEQLVQVYQETWANYADIHESYIGFWASSIVNWHNSHENLANLIKIGILLGAFSLVGSATF